MKVCIYLLAPWRKVLLDKPRFSDIEEILCIVWNPNVPYRVFNSQPPAPVLSQIKPVRAPHPIYWRSILILSFYLFACVFQLVSFLQVPEPKPSIPIPSLPIHATCLAHPILLDFIAHKIFGEAYSSLSSSFCIFLLPCYPVPLRFKYPPQYPLLKLPQPTFLPSGSIQVSHTFKTTDKTTVQYILIFIFLDSRLEDKRFCTE